MRIVQGMFTAHVQSLQCYRFRLLERRRFVLDTMKLSSVVSRIVELGRLIDNGLFITLPCRLPQSASAVHAQWDVFLYISMFHHPSSDNKGEARDIVVIETSSTSKANDKLKEVIHTCPTLILPSPAPEVPSQNGELIGNRLSLPNAFQDERGWLENVLKG